MAIGRSPRNRAGAELEPWSTDHLADLMTLAMVDSEEFDNLKKEMQESREEEW